MNLEQLGLFGVFLGGAVPWIEAVVAVPAGILFGLDPVLTLIFAVLGDRKLTDSPLGARSGLHSGTVDSLEETVDVIYKPQESEPFRFCDELETGCNPRIED